jgi:hypothetical protein
MEEGMSVCVDEWEAVHTKNTVVEGISHVARIEVLRS